MSILLKSCKSCLNTRVDHIKSLFADALKSRHVAYFVPCIVVGAATEDRPYNDPSLCSMRETKSSMGSSLVIAT